MFRRNNSIHELEKEIRTSATLYLRNRKESKSKDGKHGYFVGLKKKKDRVHIWGNDEDGWRVSIGDS